MKTILTVAFVAFFAITTSAVATTVPPAYTQSTTNSCFSYFRAHRQQNGVGMMWAVSQAGVVAFNIERSYDGEYFDPVTTVAGNGAAQYRFTDQDTYPGVLYYRIVAVMEDGSTDESPVETVRIVSRK